MSVFRTMLAGTTIAMALGLGSSAGIAAPIVTMTAPTTQQSADVQQVRHLWLNGRHGFRGGYHRGGYGRAGIGIGAGLIGGAILGGILDNAYGGYDGYYGYNNGYYGGYEPEGNYYTGSSSSCAQRFRSYNPETGYYRGYDGRLHHCT